MPAEEHDDAALDDVEPRPLLLDGPPEASSPLPPLAPHKLHPRFSSLLILLCVLCVCVFVVLMGNGELSLVASDGGMGYDI